MTDERFMIYRIYTAKERPDIQDRAVFYGWTKIKSVRNGFLEQRTKSKYKCIRMSEEEVSMRYAENISSMMDDSTMIDILKIQSAESGETVHLFITESELHQVEIQIHEIFRDRCRLDRLPGDLFQLVQMFTHLKPKYADALEFLGYRPPEVEALYDSGFSYDDLSPIEQMIDDAYTVFHDYPVDEGRRLREIPGLATLSDVADRIIYSLESFVMAMREDL